MAAVVDVVSAVHIIGKALKERIDASQNLPQTAKRCVHTIEQINGAIDGVGDDAAVEPTLRAIRQLLTELQGTVDRLEGIGATAEGSNPCTACFVHLKRGRDVLSAEKELESLDIALLKQLDTLNKAAQLAGYANRKSNVLKEKDARKFWDMHFGDDRDTSVDALCEAMQFEVSENSLDVDMALVLPILRGVFAGKERVSVLLFGQVFSKPIPETLVALSTRTVAASHLFKLKLFKMPARERDASLDLGMLMCRETDSLSALRQLIKKHALTLHEQDDDDDEEERGGEEGGGKQDRDEPEAEPDPELQFLRDGEFVFFLDSGDVRVRKKQESTFKGAVYIDKVVIVRTSDLPPSQRPKKRTTIVPPSSDPVIPGQTELVAAEWRGSDAFSEVSEPDQLDIAEAVMNLATENTAKNLDVSSTLGNAGMSQQLKKAAVKSGVGEESVAFLTELQALALEAARVEAGEASLSGLGLGAWRIMLRYFSPDSRFNLKIERSTLERTGSTVQRVCAAGKSFDASEVVECFEDAKIEVESGLTGALAAVRKAQANQERIVRQSKIAPNKARVVVVGGGWLGVVVAKKLDLLDEFFVTLIDPKEYFEDNTAQPKAVVASTPENPSKTHYEMGDQTATWSRTVINYKGSTIQNGKLVNGFLTAVRKDHVQVGSKRAVVEYDYLVLATGSAYSSGIKAMNASLEYRHKQMMEENRAVKDAKSILVIGGGLVGVEFATEIKSVWPDKTVTIVQRNRHFLPRIRNAHQHVVARFEELGVEYHVGECIDHSDEFSGKVTARSGRMFEADKVYHCEGYAPNSGFIHDPQTDPVFKAALDRRSFIKVTKFCQFEGAPNVFAGGDLVSDEMHVTTDPTAAVVIAERSAAGACSHAAVIAENIIRLEAVRRETDLSLPQLMSGAKPAWVPDQELRAYEVVRQQPKGSNAMPYMAIGLGERQAMIVSDAAQAAHLQALFPTFGIVYETPQLVLDGETTGISPDGQNLKDAISGMAIGANVVDWRKPRAEGGSDGEHMWIGMSMMGPACYDPKAPPPPDHHAQGGHDEPSPEPEPPAQPLPEETVELVPDRFSDDDNDDEDLLQDEEDDTNDPIPEDDSAPTATAAPADTTTHDGAEPAPAPAAAAPRPSSGISSAEAARCATYIAPVLACTAMSCYVVSCACADRMIGCGSCAIADKCLCLGVLYV